MGTETWRTPPGLLVVLSGPSGSGKGTVRRMLQELLPDVVYGVSATTRPPRPGERDGVDYHFLSREEFLRRVEAGEFVEWADVYGHLYGTPREPMESLVAAGRVVVVEKDVQGARTLMERYPDAVFVFVLPPSLEALQQRIDRRGTESPESRARRLESARAELTFVERYDYCIVNEDGNPRSAAERLRCIITAERCRVRRYVAAGRRFWLEGVEPPC